MTATATLSTSEEVFPTFLTAGRSAGAVNGVLYKAAYASGSGVSPGATAADNVIGTYTLPANTLNVPGVGGDNGPMLRIRAFGHFAANGNNKTVKIIFNPATAALGATVGSGGTTLLSSGVVAINALGFVLEAWVMKVGLPNANTQVGGQVTNIVGATIVSPPVSVYPAAVENADILIAITGNAATTATDIVLDGWTVEAMA
jgi:hypothetical protein